MDFDFDVKAVLPLLYHADANKPAQVFEDRYEPRYWKKGAKPVEHIAGLPEVDASEVDMKKLPPRLLLVKDAGVYLMCSSEPPMLDAAGDGKANHVVYAHGYPESVHIPGDDFGIPLEVQKFRLVFFKNPTAKTFRLRVTEDEVRFMVEPRKAAA